MLSIHFFLTEDATIKRFGFFKYDDGTEDDREIGVGFVFGPFGVSVGREYTT